MKYPRSFSIITRSIATWEHACSIGWLKLWLHTSSPTKPTLRVRSWWTVISRRKLSSCIRHGSISSGLSAWWSQAKWSKCILWSWRPFSKKSRIKKSPRRNWWLSRREYPVFWTSNWIHGHFTTWRSPSFIFYFNTWQKRRLEPWPTSQTITSQPLRMNAAWSN